MARSKFTAEMKSALLVAFESGCSVPDAATACNVNERTLKGWLTRGRKSDAPAEFAEFVRDVDRARADAEARLEEPMDRDEFRREVSKRAKQGNTTAMRLYWDILETERVLGGWDQDEATPPPFDPLAEVDELAERRRARSGS